MGSGLVTTIDSPASHPMLMFLDDLEALLDSSDGLIAWTMTRTELESALPRITWAIARVAERELRVLVEADRHSIGDEVGFTNTPLWWADATRQTKPAAIGKLKLAQALDSTHEPVRAAMAAGTVLPDQARMIVDAVDALPGELVDPALRGDAEQHLVGLAEHHDARALRILGRKVLDVLAPGIAEEHERRVLENEEHRAAATASFSMRPDGHGSMIGQFKIPVLAGEILAKHLNAIAAPRHQFSSAGFATGVERLPYPADGDTSLDAEVAQQPPRNPVSRPLRLGQAFVEYLETRTSNDMPQAGGIPATIVVTMTLADLLGANAAATLDTGETISASEARRMACGAGIIPQVLGSADEVLNQGRERRFHTKGQRIAIAHRDKGCAEQHCDWPPGMCHAHHEIPWSQGGGTSVKDGVLLCPKHHTLAHDSRYQLKRSNNGKVFFSMRT